MNKILKYGLLAVLLPVMSSCSENYLVTEPQASTSPENVFKTPEDAQYAINGIGKLMCSQYMGTQGQNGEGTMLLYFGDLPGTALQKCDWTGWQNTINGKYHENNSNGNMAFSWHYPYRIIMNANNILANTPQKGEDNYTSSWGYVRAQALVYRAHAYLRLVQVYSRRWSDRNGESRGVVLRLDPNTDEMPCSSLKEVYAQIYADLDEAITLFRESSKSSTSVWVPSEQAAHAIYSRAALTREDWSKALSEAQEASKGGSLMTSADYEAGFNAPNKEWIWSAFNSEQQDIYYYSFFAYAAANSKSSTCRTNPVAISRELVEKINPDDSRLKLYCIPTASEMPKDPSLVTGSGKVVFTKDADIEKLKTDAAKENARQMNEFYNRIKTKGGFLNNRIYSTTTLYYYLATKFQAQNDLGVGQVCIARIAEMVYNEAEAQYRLGNEAAAKAALEKAVKPYQPNYTCSKSGEALLDEILAYREFDLFGEGFSWFDMKRLGKTLVRKSWKNGGSWNASFAQTVKPDGLNRWTFCIPQIETNYNTMVQSFESENWPN